MLPALAILLALPAARGPDDSAALAAAALATMRPRSCTEEVARTVWDAAAAPSRVRFCALLGHAHATLDTAPKVALDAADAALSALSGLPAGGMTSAAAAPPSTSSGDEAAAQVARARALLRLGKARESIEAFDRALALDRRSVGAPLVLRDLAAARSRVGAHREALETYRRLLPLARLLPRTSDRTMVLLGAAHTGMRLAALLPASGGSRVEPTPESKRHLAEALGLLREAARDDGELRLDVALSLALALDRSGEPNQADAILAEVGAPESWVRTPSTSYLADPADEAALAALALERRAPKEAQEALRRYLAAVPPGHPFAVAAAHRLARPSPSSSGKSSGAGR